LQRLGTPAVKIVVAIVIALSAGGAGGYLVGQSSSPADQCTQKGMIYVSARAASEAHLQGYTTLPGCFYPGAQG
jgi:hypothetical protein